MKRIAVLGCGLVGASIARDLAADGRYRVSAVDRDDTRLGALAPTQRLEAVQVDLGSPDRVRAFVAPFDAVVGALPSRFGYANLRAVIEAGKPYCDISFMPQDSLALDGLAVERGVCAVVDCGVSPGLSNLLIGHAHARLDRTDSVAIYVGGLPRIRRWPWEYKAPFSPADVLEEYTRPARLRRGGQAVVLEALSEPELIDFEPIGTLEAFVTDGLRSLLTTLDAPDLCEKTLRYPGHAALVRALRESGFFGAEPIDLDGARVSPLALSSRLLFDCWRLEPDEAEFTVLRVVVEGQRGARRERRTWDLFDQSEPNHSDSSMARTTGFPCAIVARMLAEREVDRPGVLPPELLAPVPGLVERVLSELQIRGVVVTERVEPLG